MMRKREKLYVKYKQTKSAGNWEKFRKFRQEVKKEIRNSHKVYIKDVVGASLKDNPKTFWSYIKSLRKENTGIPTLSTTSKIPASTDLQKANALNEQFMSVFTNENINNIPQQSPKYPSMDNINFGLEGVIKLFSGINPDKASGPDKLPARYLKETATETGKLYHHLFTQSYNKGNLPSAWKHAVVCPVYKKASKSLPANYRPISLTAIPCKLIKHCIVSKIWSHLNKYNIITNKQHGFRSGMTCETQLVEAMNDWTSTLNQGSGQVDVLLLDFSKAFDVVPHRRLLCKLEMYGISDLTSKWIAGFLTGRLRGKRCF
eukprot:Seg693.6 transcript_id=Seg693.6/GoldUCD/mRNA.D3Y31 product="LINE-1 retrotransposable element ORF2 protein" protein_id=Seg693.6/GoldUCD/D3Y31